MGLNTAFVESQTSYIARLADAHCVSVGNLIGKEMAPLLGKEYLKNSAKKGGSRFYNFAIEINGLGAQANDFANVLSMLTGIDKIRELTLMPWNGVFPVKEMFRKCKAWCPVCFENSKKNEQCIYEPLIWNFKAVNICRTHDVRLITQCPNCTKEIPVLSRKTRNGLCSSCGCWLGADDTNSNQVKTVDLLWDNFVTENIENLIAMGNESSVRITDNSICTFLKFVADKAGGVCAFSRYVNIPVSTIRLWIRGINKPILYTLLKICYQVGINITDIFSTKQQCISFMPVIKGLRSVSADKIVSKNVERRKIDWHRVEYSLNYIINNKTVSAPSVCEVARNLGVDKRLLYDHFPALCKTVSGNHTTYTQMMRQKRIDEGCQKIVRR